jgi:hypothetical protein
MKTAFRGLLASLLLLPMALPAAETQPLPALR